jgi:uncharacterized repeat protein (TIGR01451 family)
MKNLIRQKLLLFTFLLSGGAAFGQGFTITGIGDTINYINPCDNNVSLSFSMNNNFFSGGNSNVHYNIQTSTIATNTNVSIVVNWGDGFTNTYIGTYFSPTSNLSFGGVIPQHAYAVGSGVPNTFTISITVSDLVSGSSMSNSNVSFTFACGTQIYGILNVDCDSNGVVDTTLYNFPILVYGPNFTATVPIAGGIGFVMNIPSGAYAWTVDPNFLQQYGYTLFTQAPQTIFTGTVTTILATVFCNNVPQQTDGCVFGHVYCDNNNNGTFDAGDVGVYNAPVMVTYDNTTILTNTDPNGFYNFWATNGNQDTAIVSVDANWLSQNGYQFTSNSTSLVLQPCQTSGNISIANFPVNCDSAQVATECIIGWVFCDANGNGSLDSGEVAIPNAPIQVTGNTNYITTIYSDSNGVFSYSGQAFFGGFAILTVPQWWLTQHGYALANNVLTVQTNCNNPMPAYFGINCSPVQCSDLWTAVTPWIGYFQNQNNYIKLKWGNNGPNATTGYTLTLTFPSSVTPVTSSILYSNYVISGNTITWTFGPGASYINEYDVIKFFVPSGYPSGTSHVYSSVITPLGATSDCDFLNNDGSVCMILGNSYDPNDKSVSHQPVISPDLQDELTYVIRFQNTGTAPAQDVYIIDTLSANLDWATLKVISTSHNMQLINMGNGVMKFNFPGIWLPDSTANEPASHGDVVFSIKEKATNTVGSEIENTGYIYFDWNPAIVTNTTFNINAYLGVDEKAVIDVNVYPNPAENVLHVVSNQWVDKLIVLDLTGKEIFSKDMNNVSTELDLTDLSAGTYMLQLISKDQMSTKRFVKK